MAVQPRPTCAVIHPGETYTGKQAFTYFAGVSSGNCGARGICMHLLTIPPLGRAKAHFHENHETAIYVISGAAGMWYGKKLEQHLDCRAGEPKRRWRSSALHRAAGRPGSATPATTLHPTATIERTSTGDGPTSHDVRLGTTAAAWDR